MKSLKMLLFGHMIQSSAAIAQTKSSTSKIHFADFKNGCKVKVSFPEGSHIAAETDYGNMGIQIPPNYDPYSQERGFNLICDSHVDDAMAGSPARLDKSTDTWVEDKDSYIELISPGGTATEIREARKSI